MKILLHSNAPWAGSGYGQQCAQYAVLFREAGHDVAISTAAASRRAAKVRYEPDTGDAARYRPASGDTY